MARSSVKTAPESDVDIPHASTSENASTDRFHAKICELIEEQNRLIIEQNARLDRQDRTLGEIRDLLRHPPKSTPRQLSSDDRAQLARLLRAISARIGSAPFTTAEVASDPTFSKLMPSGLNTHALGLLFAHLADHAVDFDNLMVIRTKAELHVRLWAVVRRVEG